MDYVKAFLVGGLFCLVGQILIDKTKLTPARILVGYVVTGVILGALGLYQPIIDFAGAGASVPLTGFGATLAKGVKDAIVKEFGAYAVEMEGAAIGQAAALNGIPFLIIRAISDKADNSANMDYPAFEKLAIEHSVRLTQGMLKRMA